MIHKCIDKEVRLSYQIDVHTVSSDQGLVMKMLQCCSAVNWLVWLMIIFTQGYFLSHNKSPWSVIVLAGTTLVVVVDSGLGEKSHQLGLSAVTT